MSVGDLVLVHDETHPRSYGKMGKVERLLMSKDGMKQLLRSKYLNHRNGRHKVEREEIESGVEMQSRESEEEEDSGLLNYKTNTKFLICILNIEQFLFERLYSLSYHYFFYSFGYLILGIEGGPFFIVHGGGGSVRDDVRV